MSRFRALLVPACLALAPGALAQKPYFQQRVDTKLEVRLDDKRHYLHGTEALRYVNNSPDTLRYLYIHLWPNAYKNDRTAFSEQLLGNGRTDFYYAPATAGGRLTENRGFIDSLDFRVGDQPVNYTSADATPDIARIDLPVPLPPGGETTVSTPFRVKIPAVFSRLGHTRQAYFISQWFPKPAVYDRNGWHPMPYLDQGEFFAEIGHYHASITLPRNYVVMATGNCLTPGENAWLDSLAALPFSADTAKLRGTVASSSELKTIEFEEDNVHDFAWFADKRYLVRKDTVTVPGSGAVVTAWAAFLPADTATWKKATQHIKDGVTHYSTWIGPYPYKTVKGVEGDMKAGGGMEYPTVTIIDKSASGDLRTVLVHEVGHNWFQGMLATNERDHPWMDEGLNSFYEWKTTDSLRQAAGAARDTARPAASARNLRSGHRSEPFESLIYHELTAIGEDQPLNLPSDAYRELNYGGDVYYKTALWARYLEAWMGEAAFEAAMHDYFDTWKHRHPGPADFEAAMRRHTTKDLDWFFNSAFTTTHRLDFALRGGGRSGDSLRVRVRSHNPFPAPARVDGFVGDSVAASAWTPPFTGTTQVALPAGAYSRIALASAIPDGKTTNNSTGRPVGLGLAGGMNRSITQKLWAFPALGYNSYDGLMAGLVLHHSFAIPEPRFRYVVAPLYGFRSKDFVGAASAGYFWFPERGALREIALQADAKTFHYNETALNTPGLLQARYLKVAPGVSVTFRERDPRSPVTRRLTVKGYYINEDAFDYTLDLADSLYKPSTTSTEHLYGTLSYVHDNARAINPFSYSFTGQAGQDFAKLLLQGNLRIDYHDRGRALYLRGFAGKFFGLSGATAERRYWLNTTFNGPADYLYDGTFLGRSERDGLSSRQVAIAEGGFKLATPYYASPLGRSDDWLLAANLSSDLPLGKLRLPIRPYFDVATFANASKLNPSGNKILYEGGLELYLPYDVLSVYFPLLLSADYKDYFNSLYGDAGLKRTITFRLRLQNINWLRATRRVLSLVS